MNDIRERVRDTAEARFFAMETLKGAIEWIRVSNPLNYLSVASASSEGVESVKKKSPLPEDMISREELTGKVRDWVNKSGDLIKKTWELPDLMVEDAISIMREMRVANEERTPESK